MKTIKHMSVKCTYRVGLYNVEVPDDVYEQLEKTEEFSSGDMRNGETLEWLSSKIREADAYDWEYEVDIE